MNKIASYILVTPPARTATAMSQQTAIANVAAIAAKLPDFYTHNPDGWFINAEAQFSLANITAERTKFHYAVRALDPKTSEEIQHFLTQQCLSTDPAATPYSNLKKELVECHSQQRPEC